MRLIPLVLMVVLTGCSPDEEDSGAEPCAAADASVFFADLDADGFGDPEASLIACELPANAVADATDCDDTNAAVNPGAAEVCNNTDDDCDSLIDDDDDSVTADIASWADSDGDGFGDPATGIAACTATEGVNNDDDCDDSNAAVHPDALEICDELDNNCTGGIDGTPVVEAEGTPLQDAIVAAADGDLLCVEPGTYIGALNFDGKKVRVESYDGPDTTIIQGVSDTIAVTFDSSETAETVLKGFTIHQGWSDPSGVNVLGASMVVDGASPTLTDLVIDRQGLQTQGLHASCGADALWLNDSDSLVERVLVTGTSTFCVDAQAPVLVQGGAPTLRNLTIIDNRVTVGTLFGGDFVTYIGVYSAGLALESTAATVSNVIITDNTASGRDEGIAWASALWVADSDLVMENLTVHANVAKNAGGEALASVYVAADAELELINTDISDNVVDQPDKTGAALYNDGVAIVSYVNIRELKSPFLGKPVVERNDPSAWAPDYAVSTGPSSYWDFALRPGSKLIDIGDPGLLDPDGTRSDIGAYGGPAAAGW